MTTIEGIAFPLGEINANGWGVPFAEADSAVKSLKTSVVRICARTSPHGCDYIGDPNSEIGHVVDAWLDGDNVWARAKITDSIAAQKIEDGVWTPNWSIFAGYNDIDSGGWAHGIAVESITIVNDPAWQSSTWKIVTASADGKKRIRRTSTFKVVSAGVENIAEDGKTGIEGGEGGEGGNAGNPAGTGLEGTGTGTGNSGEGVSPGAAGEGSTGNEEIEKKLKDLEASNKQLIGEISRLKAVAAASLPSDKVKEMIEAAKADREAMKNEIRAEIAAENALEAAFKRYEASRTALKMKTTREEVKGLSAAFLTARATENEALAASLGGGNGGAAGAGFDGRIPYVSETLEASVSKIQIYDPDKREFSDYKGA